MYHGEAGLENAEESKSELFEKGGLNLLSEYTAVQKTTARYTYICGRNWVMDGVDLRST